MRWEMQGRTNDVFIIEDDADARDSLDVLTGSMGLRRKLFASAEEFLREFDASWEGCAVIDLCLPGMSGLELIERLIASKSRLTVVMISGYGTISEVVQAMQQGAVTFIEKPYCCNALQDAIRTALALACTQRSARVASDEFQKRLTSLTSRELIVLSDMLADKPNRSIAKGLSVSLRTVARLRASVFEKFEVVSAMDLAQLIAKGRMPLELCQPRVSDCQPSSDSA